MTMTALSGCLSLRARNAANIQQNLCCLSILANNQHYDTSVVQRLNVPLTHPIGYLWDDYYTPDVQTNSVKTLKENSWSSRSGLNPTRTTPRWGRKGRGGSQSTGYNNTTWFHHVTIIQLQATTSTHSIRVPM